MNSNTMGKLCALGAAVLMSVSGAANADTLYAADNTTIPGLQGVLVIDPATLTVSGSFLTPDPVTGLAAGVGNEVYVSSLTSITRYRNDGTALATLNGLGADQFFDVSHTAGTVYATDNTTISGLQGVLMLDPTTLGVMGSFTTPNPITGLTAGNGNEVYVASAGAVTRYRNDGTALASLPGLGADSFFDLSLDGSIFYAVDNTTISGLQGVLLLDPTTLAVTGSFLVDNPIRGMAAGYGNIVYLATDDAILKYRNDGTLLGTLPGLGADRFGDLSLQVPAPASAAMVGIVGLFAGRRRRA